MIAYVSSVCQGETDVRTKVTSNVFERSGVFVSSSLACTFVIFLNWNPCVCSPLFCVVRSFQVLTECARKCAGTTCSTFIIPTTPSRTRRTKRSATLPSPSPLPSSSPLLLFSSLLSSSSLPSTRPSHARVKLRSYLLRGLPVFFFFNSVLFMRCYLGNSRSPCRSTFG